MMEAARTSETVLLYQSTWCYTPEDSHLLVFCSLLVSEHFNKQLRQYVLAPENIKACVLKVQTDQRGGQNLI
jgi:hypothetical protein